MNNENTATATTATATSPIATDALASSVNQPGSSANPSSPSPAVITTATFSAFSAERKAILSKLQSLEQREEEARKTMVGTLRTKILGLPEMFGVGNTEEVIGLIRAYSKEGESAQTATVAKGNVARTSPIPVRHRRGRGGNQPIPEQTLDQLKQFLIAGTSISQCAESLGISEASVNVYKARWGLTKPRGSKREKVIRATTRKPARRHGPLPPDVRENIKKAIADGRMPVKDIVKKFGTTRQTINVIRHELPRLAAA